MQISITIRLSGVIPGKRQSIENQAIMCFCGCLTEKLIQEFFLIFRQWSVLDELFSGRIQRKHKNQYGKSHQKQQFITGDQKSNIVNNNKKRNDNYLV